MQIKETKGNRVFFEKGYIQIKPNGDDLIFIVVTNDGKTQCPDTMEEAMEILRVKGIETLNDHDIPPNTTILER